MGSGSVIGIEEPNDIEYPYMYALDVLYKYNQYSFT